MGNITRRKFLKQTIGGVSGIVLVGSLSSSVFPGQQPPAGMSRVVVVEHPEATDGVKAINAANVQDMVDEAIMQLTGETSIADAWIGLLTDFKEDHVVAIKVNPISPMLATHPEVVDAIVTGMISVGVVENNIIIYDVEGHKLPAAGYNLNTGDAGVRCFGTSEKGWGYDQDSPVEVLGQKRLLSTVLTRCDHLINVPVLKVHLDQYGVTLALKNHYGSVDKPDTLHANFAAACAALNNQEPIRDKTRLIVTDALFGHWGGGGVWVPEFAPNSLILSKDPVAADYIGVQMIDAERAKHNLPPRNVPFLDKAADMGLGTKDPEKIELLKLNLGAPENPQEPEEKPAEEEKAINPAGSYKTKWGSIKK